MKRINFMWDLLHLMGSLSSSWNKMVMESVMDLI